MPHTHGFCDGKRTYLAKKIADAATREGAKRSILYSTRDNSDMKLAKHSNCIEGACLDINQHQDIECRILEVSKQNMIGSNDPLVWSSWADTKHLLPFYEQFE